MLDRATPGLRATARRAAKKKKEASIRTSEFAALKARVDEFSAGRRRQDEDIDRLADGSARKRRRLARYPRIDTLQESVERFAAAGDKVRAAWLLAEAEHYMRIHAQLGLAVTLMSHRLRSAWLTIRCENSMNRALYRCASCWPKRSTT